MAGIVRRALVRQIERLETSNRALEQTLECHRELAADYAYLKDAHDYVLRALEVAENEARRLHDLYEPADPDVEILKPPLEVDLAQ
jgi:hypothetical protein